MKAQDAKTLASTLNNGQIATLQAVYDRGGDYNTVDVRDIHHNTIFALERRGCLYVAYSGEYGTTRVASITDKGQQVLQWHSRAAAGEDLTLITDADEALEDLKSRGAELESVTADNIDPDTLKQLEAQGLIKLGTAPGLYGDAPIATVYDAVEKLQAANAVALHNTHAKDACGDSLNALIKQCARMLDSSLELSCKDLGLNSDSDTDSKRLAIVNSARSKAKAQAPLFCLMMVGGSGESITVNGRKMTKERAERMAEMGDADCIAALKRHAERVDLASQPKTRVEDPLAFVEYKIAESRVESFEKWMQKKVNTVRKVNAKILEQLKTMSEATDEEKAAYVFNPEPRWTIGAPMVDEGADGMYLYRIARVSLPEIKFPGNWTVAARIDVNNSDDPNKSNVINRVNGYDGPINEHNWIGCDCQHCKLIRKRDTLWIVTNEEGEWRRVANNCLVEFMGVDGHSMLSMMNQARDYTKATCLKKWQPKSQDTCVDVVDFLHHARSGQRVAQRAWSLASSIAYHRRHISEDHSSAFVERYAPNAKQRAEVVEMLDWVAGLETKDEALRNIKGACSFPGVQLKHARLVASLWAAYRQQTGDRYKLTEKVVSGRGQFMVRVNVVDFWHQQNQGKWLIEALQLRMINRHYDSYTKSNRFYFTDNEQGHSESRKLTKILKRHFDPCYKPEPIWSVTDGTYVIELEEADPRFMHRCHHVLDFKHLTCLSTTKVVTRDRDTAVEAFNQARWCLANPESV